MALEDIVMTRKEISNNFSCFLHKAIPRYVVLQYYNIELYSWVCNENLGVVPRLHFNL